jgi:DtxR family transcriptional regulator, Mn-dependent transcriptional regulator
VDVLQEILQQCPIRENPRGPEMRYDADPGIEGNNCRDDKYYGGSCFDNYIFLDTANNIISFYHKSNRRPIASFFTRMTETSEQPEPIIAGRKDHTGSVISQSVEDYLKAIYTLQERTGASVSTTELASALLVAPASVTNMNKRLSGLKLIDYEAYKGVRLTEAGVRIALEIIRHHRLLETYLREMLGYSWAEMHAEAERLEHHISEEFESRIDKLLGYPTHDPHGHPIPTRSGEMVFPPTIALSEAESGSSLAIHHIGDSDPELLNHLESVGLLPRTPVLILERSPFNGPLTVRVDGVDQVVGFEIARHIFVMEA